MKKTTLLLIIITLIAKVSGFLKDIVLSYYYGASSISDVYLISLTIPTGIFAFVGAAISTGFIPMYSKIEKIEGSLEAEKYTSNLINIILLICTVIIIIAYIFSEQIVRAFASGFEGEVLELTINFTRIGLLQIYAMGIIYIFNGFLQIKKNYIVPALILLPLNFLTIFSIIISHNYGILYLAIGTLLATFSQLIFLIPFIVKKKFKYYLFIDIKDKNIKNMAKIALPVIIGASVNEINILIDRTIASNIVEGGISALTYANKLNQFFQGIFVITIATVIYPEISRMAAEKNLKGVRNTLRTAILGVIIFIIPVTVGTMFFSKQVVSLLFGRGAFDEQAVSLTSIALFFYSLGMIGFGLREILSRAFYAIQDTKTPMLNGIVGMFVNIVLNIVLSKYLGLGGLALATSFSALFTVLLLFINLRKKIGSLNIKKITSVCLKVCLSSLAMGGISKICFVVMSTTINQYISFFVSVLVGFLLYVIFIFIMKIEDVSMFLKKIKK